MFSRFVSAPIGIYAATFVGLVIGDVTWGGVAYAVEKLPVRLAIYAVVGAIFLWMGRRRRTIR